LQRQCQRRFDSIPVGGSRNEGAALALRAFYLNKRTVLKLIGYIAIFAFIACLTVGKARLQAISGHDLLANHGIAVLS
jgi:hypothetical protein